jgi:lipid-binding SYLF domain-containing protein
MLRLPHLAAVGAVAMLTLAAPAYAADTPATASAEANAIVVKSEAALQAFRSDPQFAPNVTAAMRQGRAVLVVPDYIRAGIGIGGATGTGALLSKDAQSVWGSPKFFDIRAANLGPQLGYQKGDLLIVIANQATLDAILKGDFTLSADAAFQLGGDSGRTEASTTTALANTGVVAFLRGEGAYAGATVGGAKISANDDLNKVAAAGPGVDRLRSALTTMSGPSMAIKP